MNAKNSSYNHLFQSLQQKQQIAWIPFIMMGYPNLETSVQYIKTFIENGADALEIGIPFSDPVADGLLIQESAKVALENNVTIKACFAALGTMSEQYPEVPIGLLTYANLVYRPGIENFYADCKTAGIDSVLIADLPLVEAKPFIAAANKSMVDAVFIAPPNASESTLQSVSELESGYTYVVSRPGVTGDSSKVEYPVRVVNSLLKYGAPPPVLGFGISKPEHVSQAIEYGFRGVISGSAITRIITDNLMASNEGQIIDKLIEFSLMMKSATQGESDQIIKNK